MSLWNRNNAGTRGLEWNRQQVECGYEDYVAADDNITITEELNDAELVELRNSSVHEEYSDDDDTKEDAVPIAPSKSSVLQALDVINDFNRAENASVDDL